MHATLILLGAVHHGCGLDSNTGSLRSPVCRVWHQDSVGELLLNCSCMSAYLHVCMSACLHVCMSACLHFCMYLYSVNANMGVHGSHNECGFCQTGLMLLAQSCFVQDHTSFLLKSVTSLPMCIVGLLQQHPSQQSHLHPQRGCGMCADLSAAEKLVVAIVCGHAHLAAETSLEAPPCSKCGHPLH